MKGTLIDNRVILNNLELWEKSNFGKPFPEKNLDRLELDLIEAFYLLEKGEIEVYKDDKKLSKEEFLKYCNKKIKNFYMLYIVFKDLRDKGYTVKTGFKFGTHFRVYEKGVKIKKGPKEPYEHTKYVLHVAKEEDVFSLPEMSRAVRLAQNIRAKMLWAVVDRENNVTYYEVISCA